MKRHERGIGGTPAPGLTERQRTLKAEAMEPEPGDLTVIDAVQAIMHLHNDTVRPERGVMLYDPFNPEFGTHSHTPRIGYVSVSCREVLKRDPLIIEQLVKQVQAARREQANPDSGRVY